MHMLYWNMPHYWYIRVGMWQQQAAARNVLYKSFRILFDVKHFMFVILSLDVWDTYSVCVYVRSFDVGPLLSIVHNHSVCLFGCFIWAPCSNQCCMISICACIAWTICASGGSGRNGDDDDDVVVDFYLCYLLEIRLNHLSKLMVSN